MKRRCVLVGGGVAAAATAAHLRENGYDGEVVLVAAEDVLPYERPPLSKDFLTGACEFPGLYGADWYRDKEIELMLGVSVDELDVTGQAVGLSTGERLAYTEVVLATGVRPRKLPGFDGEGVHYLRTAADATGLRAEMSEVDRVTVLGAGFVGCEVAASAIGLGKQVTVFEPEPVPLRRVLGETIGKIMTDIHRERGVVVRAGEYVTELTRTRTGLVLTTNLGDRVETDLVVVGVGSAPNSELAEAAGLAVDNGILVDEYGRTSVSTVYAAGDVARQHHPRYGTSIRVEHHDTATRQGMNLALNICGTDTPFAESHWFWSDQYDHSVQSAGRIGDPADLVVRGDLAARNFSAFSLAGNRIQGVLALNRPRDVFDTRKLLFQPHEVTPEQLADESVPLKRLRPAARTR